MYPLAQQKMQGREKVDQKIVSIKATGSPLQPTSYNIVHAATRTKAVPRKAQFLCWSPLLIYP